MRYVKAFILLIVVLALGFGPAAALLSGCKPVESPQATISVVSEAVRIVDRVCADTAAAREDEALLVKCSDGYNVARMLLEQAEAANEPRSGACHLKDALTVLGGTVKAVQDAGGWKPNPIVTSALALAPVFYAQCLNS